MEAQDEAAASLEQQEDEDLEDQQDVDDEQAQDMAEEQVQEEEENGDAAAEEGEQELNEQDGIAGIMPASAEVQEECKYLLLFIVKS